MTAKEVIEIVKESNMWLPLTEKERQEVINHALMICQPSMEAYIEDDPAFPCFHSIRTYLKIGSFAYGTSFRRSRAGGNPCFKPFKVDPVFTGVTAFLDLPILR